MSTPVAAIDLFCGAGGLSYGLAEAGIDVVAGIDIDDRCRYPYEANIQAQFVCDSVRDITRDQLSDLWADAPIRVLAGCAPCQPFSSQRKGAAAATHVAWDLLNEFARLIVETQPEYVTMENVAPLQAQPIFHDFVATLNKLEYSVDYAVVKTEQYGLPQRRRRLVLLASATGHIEIPSPTISPGDETTVEQAIGGLPPLSQGESCPTDPLHKARRLSPINQARIAASKPGGTWKDWPHELRAACHQKESGHSFQSFYGVMEADQPSPTITTQFYNYGSGRFGHPTQQRTITPREAAILQGFPHDYAFIPPGHPIYLSTVGTMIGNAVPPVIGEIVGTTIRRHAATHQQ